MNEKVELSKLTITQSGERFKIKFKGSEIELKNICLEVNKVSDPKATANTYHLMITLLTVVESTWDEWEQEIAEVYITKREYVELISEFPALGCGWVTAQLDSIEIKLP